MSICLQACSCGSSHGVDKGRSLPREITAARVWQVSAGLEQAQARAWKTLVRQHHMQFGEIRRRRAWQVWSTPERRRDSLNIERSLPDFEELDKDELRTFLDLELESDFDFEMSRHYEIMFLIHEDFFEDVQTVIKKVQDFIAEKKGKVWRLNDWGLRRLCYKIKKANKAYYVLMNIEISSQAINQLNTLLEKDERVIRHMCITQKEAITAACEPPPEYFPEADPGSDKDNDDSEKEEEEEEEEDPVLQEQSS